MVPASAEGCSFCSFRRHQGCAEYRTFFVWAFSLAVLELFTPKTPSEGIQSPPFELVTAPSATNSNLHAQEGVFTFAQSIPGDRSPVDRRSLDQVLGDWIKKYQNKLSSHWFYRVTLPKSLADNLCWELAHEGITQATLFPNFSGVVAAMRDMNRWMCPGGPGYATFRKHSTLIQHKTGAV